MASTYAGRIVVAVQDSAGNALTATQVKVLVTGTATLATLYTTRLKAATAANPATTDGALGNLSVWVDPGIYDLQLASAASPFAVGVSVPDDPEENVSLPSGGSDGQVLTKDAAEALGVKWAAGSAAAASHDSLTGVTANQHHPQAHALTGADHTGTLAHSALGSVGVNDHHAQAHTDSDHSDGANVKKATVTTKGDLYVASAASTPARLGVGTDAFVLTADSAQAAGVKWAAAPGASGGIAATIFDAKGDLIAASAADAAARLPAGTNTQVLVADSAQATGLKWADSAALTSTAASPLGTAAAGSSNEAARADHVHPTAGAGAGLIGYAMHMRVGKPSPPWRGGTAPINQAVGVARLVPVYFSRSGTLDRIGTQVKAAGAAGALLRFGIYDHTSDVPGNLLLDAGTVDATTIGYKYATISYAVTVGTQYWLLVVFQGQSCSIENSDFPCPVYAYDDFANAYSYGYVGITGALPATLTAASLTQGGEAPRILTRSA